MRAKETERMDRGIYEMLHRHVHALMKREDVLIWSDLV